MFPYKSPYGPPPRKDDTSSKSSNTGYPAPQNDYGTNTTSNNQVYGVHQDNNSPYTTTLTTSNQGYVLPQKTSSNYGISSTGNIDGYAALQNMASNYGVCSGGNSDGYGLYEIEEGIYTRRPIGNDQRYIMPQNNCHVSQNKAGAYDMSSPTDNTGFGNPQNSGYGLPPNNNPISTINQPNPDMKECPICFTSVHQGLLARHVEISHLVNNVPYCTICDKTSADTFGLIRHYRLQHALTDVRTFVCSWPGCGKSFKRAQARDVHYNSIHLKEKDYMCGYCDAEFAELRNLNDHLDRKHPYDGTAPYKQRPK